MRNSSGSPSSGVKIPSIPVRRASCGAAWCPGPIGEGSGRKVLIRLTHDPGRVVDVRIRFTARLAITRGRLIRIILLMPRGPDLAEKIRWRAIEFELRGSSHPGRAGPPPFGLPRAKRPLRAHLCHSTKSSLFSKPDMSVTTGADRHPEITRKDTSGAFRGQQTSRQSRVPTPHKCDNIGCGAGHMPSRLRVRRGRWRSVGFLTL